MNIVILDDYQDAVRKLRCAAKLDPYTAKVYTNTVKGIGQLSIRLKDADVIVLQVEQIGGIACHTGRESCFYRVYKNGEWTTVEPVLKDPHAIYAEHKHE